MTRAALTVRADNRWLARTAPFLSRTPITLYTGSTTPRSRFLRRAAYGLTAAAIFAAGVASAGVIWW